MDAFELAEELQDSAQSQNEQQDEGPEGPASGHQNEHRGQSRKRPDQLALKPQKSDLSDKVQGRDSIGTGSKPELMRSKKRRARESTIEHEETRATNTPSGTLDGNPYVQQSENPFSESKMPLHTKALIVFGILFIVALFFFINWLIYKLIGLVFGGFLSFIAIVMAYYYSARSLVRYFVFPGSFNYNTRGIEFQWGQQMAAQIGETSSNFRQLLQTFMITYTQLNPSADIDEEEHGYGGQKQMPFYCDAQQTAQFLQECSQLKKIVKQYHMQIDRIDSNYTRTLDTEFIEPELMNLSRWQVQGMNDEMLVKKKRSYLQKLYPVHDDQIELYNALKELKIRMQNTWAWYGGDKLTLWKLSDVLDQLNEQGIMLSDQTITSSLQFENTQGKLKFKFEKMFLATQAVEEIVHEMIKDVKGFRAEKSRMLNCKVLGTMTQMMSDMEEMYGAQHQMLRTVNTSWSGNYDRLQVFWLPAWHTFQQMHGTKISAASTIIICNPNLGYAQLQQYSNQWLQFYLKYGINIVLWNYRGYASSTGIPSPQNIREDAELVFQWARQKTIQGLADGHSQDEIRIGAHGISIGGIAAAHLGRIGYVDFLFMDRTFQDLLSFPRQIHPLLSHLLKFITMWDNPQNSKDYMYTNCYKVVAQDPADDVIPDACSLKTGVSYQVLINEIENKALSNVIFCGQNRELISKSISINQYYHVLNKSETSILFTSLEAIFKHIFELEVHDRKVRRRFAMISNASEPKTQEQVDKRNVSGDHLDRMQDKSQYQSTMQKILTSRHKKLQKDGIQEPQDNAAILGEISNYRMNDSFLAGQNFGGYLETEREEDPNSPTSAEKKIQPNQNDMMNMEQSMYIEDTSYDLDCSINSGRSSVVSPCASPRVSIGGTEVAKLTKEERTKARQSLKNRLVNDLGQIRLTAKMRDKEKALRKHLATQKNRTLRQSEKQKMIADFVSFVEVLVNLYRISEKLDAAGDTLARIFQTVYESGSEGQSSQKYLNSFRNWIINFDVWGSFLPLTAQGWEITQARAAAYEKLSIFRASLRDFIKQNQKSLQENRNSRIQESAILTNLMTNISMVEFYFAKIESYLRRKQDNVFKALEFDDKISERTEAQSVQNQKTGEKIDQDLNQKKQDGKQSLILKTNRSGVSDSNPNSGDELIHQDSGQKLVKDYQASEMESEADHDLEFYDKIQTMRQPDNSNVEFMNFNQQIEFKDFLEPNVIKTGHIIPTSAGHNGHLSVTELVLYEIHLNNAGFLNNYQTEEQILESQAQMQAQDQDHADDYGAYDEEDELVQEPSADPMGLELDIEEDNTNFQLDMDTNQQQNLSALNPN